MREKISISDTEKTLNNVHISRCSALMGKLHTKAFEKGNKKDNLTVKNPDILYFR